MSEPMKFRKKPVVIEALKYRGIENANQCIEFTRDKAFTKTMLFPMSLYLVIPTLEGEMTASPGDWIIKDVKGEFYPCKPDVFDITYEPETQKDTILVTAASTATA